MQMMQQRVVRLFAASLTTLGSTIDLLQLLGGETILVDPVAQTPRTPLLLLHQIPSGTYRKVIKHSTIFTRVQSLVLTTGDSTPELLVIPIRRRIIMIIIRILRLLGCPLGLSSVAMGLKLRTESL